MTDKEKEALLILAGWKILETCRGSDSKPCWVETDAYSLHYRLNDAFGKLNN